METSYERTTTTKTYNVTHSVPPHTLVITRTDGSPGSWGGDRTTRRTNRTSAGGSGDVSFSEDQYALVTATGANALSREEERKDLQNLNDRFAGYIEKLRLSEAQNRKLADELDKLWKKWGKETEQIKAMFQAELDEARQALDEAAKEKARLEIKVASVEEQMEEIHLKLTIAQQELAMYTEKRTRQTQQITDYEYQISLLRKQLEWLETEREKDRNKITELEGQLAKVREDLDEKTFNHIHSDNRRETLEEQIEFLKSIHDQEVKELAALAYRDTSPESREFWKYEMAQAIREIDQMYVEKLDIMKTEMRWSYDLRLQQLREAEERRVIDWKEQEALLKDLRNNVTGLREKINDLDNRNNQLAREIDALRRAKEDRERELDAENVILRRDADGARAELDAILRELQMITDTKMGLELEIAAYRKLLEMEEIRENGESLPVTLTLKSVSATTAIIKWSAVQDPVSATSTRLLVRRVAKFDGDSLGGVEDDRVRVAASESTAIDGHYHLDELRRGQKYSAQLVVDQLNTNLSNLLYFTTGERWVIPTIYTKSAKGAIAVNECPPNGTRVNLENTGGQEENIMDWTIRRTVDGKERDPYKLDDRFKALEEGAKIAIWAKGAKPKDAKPSEPGVIDFEMDEPSWGVGSLVITRLYNTEGEERASLTMRTVYS